MKEENLVVSPEDLAALARRVSELENQMLYVKVDQNKEKDFIHRELGVIEQNLRSLFKLKGFNWDDRVPPNRRRN